jgi:hypothetical protein
MCESLNDSVSENEIPEKQLDAWVNVSRLVVHALACAWNLVEMIARKLSKIAKLSISRAHCHEFLPVSFNSKAALNNEVAIPVSVVLVELTVTGSQVTGSFQSRAAFFANSRLLQHQVINCLTCFGIWQ